MATYEIGIRIERGNYLGRVLRLQQKVILKKKNMLSDTLAKSPLSIEADGE